MEDKNCILFVHALIKDTLSGRLDWRPLSALEPELEKNCEVFRPTALFQCEFRQILISRSYYCNTNAGVVYLTYEIGFSGMDGSSDIGMWLFLHPEPYSYDSFSILSQSEELYRLENAVRLNIAKNAEAERNQDYYLDLFLRSSSSDR